MSERSASLLASSAGAAAVLLAACSTPTGSGPSRQPESRVEPEAPAPAASSGGAGAGAVPESSAQPSAPAAGGASESSAQPSTPAAGAAPAAMAPAPAEPAMGFSQEGQCSFEGSGVFRDGAYSGTLAFILLAEPSGDEELCRIRFALDTVANADPECDFCLFSTVVRRSNPVEVVNVDDLCENSERALAPATIEAMLAAPVAMGFAEEATGHGQILVEYDPSRERWAEVTFGSFEPSTGMLSYSKNEGFCRY